MERSRQVRRETTWQVLLLLLPAEETFLGTIKSKPCAMADLVNRASQVMAAEKDRDIARMTMARQVEETEADLRIHRIQGGRNGFGTHLPPPPWGLSFVCLKLVYTYC